MERDGGRHCPFIRHLHGDGHGRNHDGDRRGARPCLAGRLLDPGGRFQPSSHVRRRRPPHRRHGLGRPHPRPHLDSGRLRQRHQGPHGDGRLDQRHHSRGGDGAPRRHRARDGALRPALTRDPGAGQCPAVGEIPDGGLFLCRRPAGADAGAQGPARPRLHDRDRKYARREHRRRGSSSARRHSSAERSHLPAKAPPLFSPATWRRAAAS